MHRWFRRLILVCITLAALTAVPTQAQSALKGPLRILVGFAAGGSSDMMELHRAEKIRIIATSGAQCSPLLPAVATFREQGFPSIEGSGWIGVYVPSKTPKRVIDQLSAAIVKALQIPEVKERFLTLGYEPTGTTPEALAAIMAADTARWGPIIKRSGFSE